MAHADGSNGNGQANGDGQANGNGNGHGQGAGNGHGNGEARRAFPGSQKVYVTGSRPDLRVPFREVALAATRGRQGETPNAPVRLYDTSGPYTDLAVAIDFKAGLAP